MSIKDIPVLGALLSKFTMPDLKTILQTLGIAIVGAILGRFIPWWVMVPIFGIVGAYLGKNPRASFLMGMTSGIAIWGGYAGVLDSTNAGVLSNKIGLLLTKGTGSITGQQLVYYTGLLGGLLAGMGAWTGSLARLAFGTAK